MAVPGLDLALATAPTLLVLSGVTGMLGAASVDLGPFAPLEQAALAEVATPRDRNLAFGRYSLTGGLFNAAGGLAAAFAGAQSGRVYFLLYAAIGLATGALPLLMSRRGGAGRPPPALPAVERPPTAALLAGPAGAFSPR